MKKTTVVKSLIGETLNGLDFKMSSRQYQTIYIPTLEQSLIAGGFMREEWQGSGHRIISFQKFIQEAKEGNLNQVELVFAKPGHVQVTSEYWNLLTEKRHYFLSQKWCKNIQNFASEQIHRFQPRKCLNKIKEITFQMNRLDQKQLTRPFIEVCHYAEQKVTFAGIEIDSYINEIGELMLDFSGHSYKADILGTLLRDKFRALEVKLGTRATVAAEEDFSFNDMKQFLTAFKLLNQAKEAILNSDFELPNPLIAHLNEIRIGKITLDAAHQELLELYSELNQLTQTRWLPDTSLELDKLTAEIIKKAHNIK